MANHRPRPTTGLTISDSGLNKIKQRDFELDDAVAVLNRDPLWKWQESRLVADELGNLRRVPARWRMVGRGAAGRLLCVILDLPGATGASEVVTIYDASPKHQSQYDDWVRRRT